MTAEKQSPSALDFFASVQGAINVEQRITQAKGASKKPLKDMLTKVSADYNRMVSSKKHRIDGSRKLLCYNMFLVLLALLHFI